MATITTDTFLDSGTARTAGETWAINGCTLTVRTDTRWHANAPASMTGTLGSITTSSENIGFYVDGTNVRWMEFDSGAGVVPAIGTTITQGGVSGYLLGVWSSLTAAPTAVGAAMPATGFLKFREVTGGVYATGALTGISANATSEDITGWIEIVRDVSASISGGKFGLGFKFQGDWFSLGSTSGTPGQLFQLPTNGGGASTFGLGLQIETSPGSGVFEWYPALATTQWATTLITTDTRAKLCQQAGGGVLRIGSDGTSNIGFTPPAGCAVRTPNIFLRHAATATRASNAYNTATRPGLDCSYSKFNFDKVSCDWYVNHINSFEMNATNTVFSEALGISTPQGNPSLSNICISNPAGSSSIGFATTNIITSLVINNLVMVGATTTLWNMSGTNNLTATNVKLIFTPATSRSSIGVGIQTGGSAQLCTNLLFTNLSIYACALSLGQCQNSTFTNTDFIERMSGDTTSTAGPSAYVAQFSSSAKNIIFNGLTWGQNGALNNCHPYATSAIFVINGAHGGIRVRNVGTVAAPLAVGASSLLYPGAIISTSNSNASPPNKFQRIFVANTRTAPIVFAATALNHIFEQVGYSTHAGSNPGNTDAFYKGIYLNSPLSAVNALGGMWWDSFVSTTAGKIVLFGSAPRALYSAYVTETYTNPLISGFGTSGCRMGTLGDYFISEMPYFAKGHTGFQNVSPTMVGANFNVLASNFQYQIDTGSGWNGTWKTPTGANLSAEIIDSNVGFKLKIKVISTATSSSSNFQVLNIQTTTTAVAQQQYFYKLDTNTLGFTGLITGSEVRVYEGTDPATAVEIGGAESTAGSTFEFTHSSGGSAGVIAIFAMGYMPIYLPYTFKTEDETILIQPVVDRNYTNPV